MQRKFARGLSAVAVSIVMAGTSVAGDPVRSGLKAGDSVNVFLVDDITGPNKGTTLCYRCSYGTAPVVCVFARKTSEPLANLVKQIDAKIGENGALKSFVVLIPRKGEVAAEDLRTLAEKAGITHVPLTIGESPDGPPDYKIAQGADVTVLMWNQQKVKVNHAFKSALTDANARTIMADIPRLLRD